MPFIEVSLHNSQKQIAPDPQITHAVHQRRSNRRRRTIRRNRATINDAHRLGDVLVEAEPMLLLR